MPVNVYGMLFEIISIPKHKFSLSTNALGRIVFPELTRAKSVLRSPAITQYSTLYSLKQFEIVFST